MSSLTPSRYPLPRPRVTGIDVLYLDFDGVLHPQDVRMDGGVPYVRSPPGHGILENAPVLQGLLTPYPNLNIVLSTTWVRRFGYRGAVRYLHPELQRRCIGATWHRGMGRYRFDFMTRGEQVLDDVKRRGSISWLAIDDNTEGWGVAESSHLIATDPILGLGQSAAIEKLAAALTRFAEHS
jgi:hypothetical protein